MERTDTIGKLQQQLESATEEIKKLKGDMQSRDRESVNLRKRIEVEKFKSDLDNISNKAKASGTVYEKRLEDTLSTIKEQLKNEAKKLSSPSSSGKEAAKRRKK